MILTIRRQAWLQHMTWKIQLQLTLTSFFEWGGALLTFLAVGYALSVDMPLAEVMIIFIVGTIVGVISLLPGGLGSFDVLMITSLKQLGISHKIAISWLLIYRLVYFSLPFILGITLFAGGLGTRFNQRFSGVPKQLIEYFSQKTVTVMLYISCILFVLSNIMFIHISKWHISSYFTVPSHLFVPIASIVLGFLLLFASRTSVLQLSKAYWPTIFLLVAAIIFGLIRHYPWITIMYFILVLVCALLSKKKYKKQGFCYSWEAFLMDGWIHLWGALLILSINMVISFIPLKDYVPIKRNSQNTGKLATLPTQKTHHSFLL